MGKRGPIPEGKVKLEWSANFAYAIGLLVTDGCMYSDYRHVALVSNDVEQLEHFLIALQIKNKIGKHASGLKNAKQSYRVQVGDVNFINFLLSIGVTPKKSKTIGKIKLPKEYFFDFLRGCFDGDGYSYSYWDKRWRSSFMFYIGFTSASMAHIDWLRGEIESRLKIRGHVTKGGVKICYQLKYAKKEALVIIDKMYYNSRVVCLSRKRLKIKKAFKVELKQQKLYL